MDYDTPASQPADTGDVPPQGSPGASDLGLSIDILDVDRLRDWARLILVYGADIRQWGDPIFVASKLQIIATGMEHAVRDIGILRARSSDLLAALKLIESVYRLNVVHEREPGSVLDAVQAAIAKAEGR